MVANCFQMAVAWIFDENSNFFNLPEKKEKRWFPELNFTFQIAVGWRGASEVAFYTLLHSSHDSRSSLTWSNRMNGSLNKCGVACLKENCQVI